jgi:signal peptidase I
MHSLGIWIGFQLICLPMMAWAMGRAARAVGSPRGRMAVGMLAVLLLVAMGIGDLALASLLPPLLPRLPAMNMLVLELILGAVQLYAIFAFLRRTFMLSTHRTWAPFGAFLGVPLLQVGLVIAFVRPYLCELFIMHTANMSPTIEPSDRFIACKIIQPRRWDIVMYWNSSPKPTRFCQRLIALPGERLRFDDGTIFINDQPVVVPAVIAGKCHATITSMPTLPARYADGQTIVLGPNEYFFMGDHTEISYDSRFVGPTDRSKLVGVVDVIYSPLNRFRVLR